MQINIQKQHIVCLMIYGRFDGYQVLHAQSLHSGGNHEMVFVNGQGYFLARVVVPMLIQTRQLVICWLTVEALVLPGSREKVSVYLSIRSATIVDLGTGA